MRETDLTGQEPALDAQLYSVLAHLYSRPPNNTVSGSLVALGPALRERYPAFDDLQEILSQRSEALLDEEFFALFIGLGKGEVMPYASWHRDHHLFGSSLLAIRRSLAELGLAKSKDSKEPEDHIAFLFEVMACLLQAGREAEARHFLQQHILSWSDSFTAAVEAAKSAVFYRQLALFTAFFMRWERRMNGL